MTLIDNPNYGRRGFLMTLAGGIGCATFARAAGGKKTVRIAEFDASGKKTGVAEVEKVVKPNEEWKKQLSPIQFEVTRQEGTERAFSGKYAETHDDGLYACVCCKTTLFDSKTKFDSGTGWPSFYQPLVKENVREMTDSTFGMSRTKVNCARCDGHLGHVFNDGPKPTGLRYCMNSASLDFSPRKA